MAKQRNYFRKPLQPTPRKTALQTRFRVVTEGMRRKKYARDSQMKK